MKKEVIDFSDIFHYAKDKYGIEWNPCNDIFFNTVIKYKGATNFYKFDILSEKDVPGYSYDGTDEENSKAVMNFKVDKEKLMSVYKDSSNDYVRLCARIIINQYLIENNIEDNEFLILGD